MNDSLVDELEGSETTPYQPLLGIREVHEASPHNEEDVWAELNEDTNQSKSSGKSLKDRIINTLSDRTRGSHSPEYTSLRKHDMPPVAGINLFHEGGGKLPDNFGRISNLDAFFSSLYNYYYQKGLSSIVTSGVISLINLIFTIFLSTFLLGCVNWGLLYKCGLDSSKCNSHLGHYVSCRADWGMYKVVVFFYFSLFLAYWIWSVLSFVATCRDSMEMHQFYLHRLKVDSRELQTMSWDEVLNRLNSLQANSSGFKLQISDSDLSPHDIACRIMRKDNYLISMLNLNVLNLNIPIPSKFSKRANRVFFSRNMEWNLHFTMLNHMFGDEFRLQHAFLMDIDGLKKRFVITGILNFVLLPFMLLFMIVQFFLKYTQECHTKRNYLGPRQWSQLALWRFREYNELPHVFDARISATYPLAQKYQDQFPASIISSVARGVSFISGSLVAVLLFCGLIGEGILLEVHIFQRPLLWYATVFTAIFTMARSFVSTNTEQVEKGDPEEFMLQLSSHTHYFPEHWKGSCHTFDVLDEFHSLFQYKAQLFFQECISVVVTPYLLCFALPRCAEAITNFVQLHTVNAEGLGAVCRHSRFDFGRYNSKQPELNADGTYAEEEVRGKMEKSFINFKQNHPDWRGSAEGEQMLERIVRYKGEQQTVALEKSMAMFTSGINFSTQGANNDNEDKAGDSTVDFGRSMFGNDSLSMSHQLLQSQAIQSALNSVNYNQHENNFYWLEKYYQDSISPDN